MNLQAFMLQEDQLKTKVEKVVSKRYKEAFVFQSISPERDAQLKAECTKKRTGAKGKQEVEFLAPKYQNLLIIESLVHPDLNNKELQDHYKVMGAEELFNKMFNPGEVIEMFLAAQEANGYEERFEDLVEEAKN